LEASKTYNAVDRLGYGHQEIDKMIEAGVTNEEWRKFFENISKAKKKDHPVLKGIKSKIWHMLE